MASPSAPSYDEVNGAASLAASSNADKPDSKTESTPKTDADTNKNEEEENRSEYFECNICLDVAKDPVVSLCGHLFCWPCLHTWLETRPTRQCCPVCKSVISREKVVPLYGRGNTKQEDPRNKKVPPRPAGQRQEPEPNSFQGFGFGDGGFHMSFGIGAFPFGFFTSTFNIGEPRPAAPQRGTPQFDEDQYLSKVFLWVAVIFLMWLIIA